MTAKSPVLTLLIGAALAALLLTLSSQAATPARWAGADAPATSPSPAGSPAGSPAVVEPPATYAGATTGGAATLAIAVKDGQAVAYLCDGRRVESWLRGTATGGVLSLTGSHAGSLTGRYGGGRASGTVSAGGRQWTFQIAEVLPPSGLYRAAAPVRGASVVGGWIVLPDGTQVGLVDTGDVAQPAPPLDPGTGTASLDGTVLPATRLDGTAGL